MPSCKELICFLWKILLNRDSGLYFQFKIRIIIINIFFFKDNQVWSFYFLFPFKLIKNLHHLILLSFYKMIIEADNRSIRKSYRPFFHPAS